MERVRHLAIVRAVPVFKALVGSIYVRRNTWVFLDTAGIAGFIDRVGPQHLPNVRSVVLPAPTLVLNKGRPARTAPFAMAQMAPETIALPLFTELRSPTLLDQTFMFKHWGVNFTIEYLYKLAEFRPSLRHVDVIDVLDTDFTRFLIQDVWLRGPDTLLNDAHALRTGLARLNLDLNDRTLDRGNPYYPDWFQESQLGHFVRALGGQNRFPRVYAAPGGADVHGEMRTNGNWGEWAQDAAFGSWTAGRPPATGAWPAPMGRWPAPPADGRYAEADAQGAREATARTAARFPRVRVLTQDEQQRNYMHVTALQHGRRGATALHGRGGPWPLVPWHRENHPEQRWQSHVTLRPGRGTTAMYPTMLRRHYPGVVGPGHERAINEGILGRSPTWFSGVWGPHSDLREQYRLDTTLLF